ncbi:MAG: transposase [Chitinophagaceae bacterium]
MLQAEFIYHIYNHANGNENLFRIDENYRYFLEKYNFYISPIAYTYCYCLMPNHFHLLIKIKPVKDIIQNSTWEKFQLNKNIQRLESMPKEELFAKFLSQQFSNLFNSYSKSYNKMYNRKGSLFIPRFKFKLIDNENYYTRIIHYIHANPIHHNFVTKIEDWKWSSYSSFFSAKKTQLNKKDVVDWFGNIEEFKLAHKMNYDLSFANLLE